MFIQEQNVLSCWGGDSQQGVPGSQLRTTALSYKKSQLYSLCVAGCHLQSLSNSTFSPPDYSKILIVYLNEFGTDSQSDCNNIMKTLIFSHERLFLWFYINFHMYSNTFLPVLNNDAVIVENLNKIQCYLKYNALNWYFALV